ADTPPEIQYHFIEQTVQPGAEISLKCSARGRPTPKIHWNLDGFPIPNHAGFVIGQFVTGQGDVISHANISHVATKHGGRYECRASNKAGEDSHEERLNVYGPPVVREMATQTAVVGEDFRISCPVGGFPIKRISWFKGLCPPCMPSVPVFRACPPCLSS
ncbi:unnamed protein product, partial [Darwinula stevensoni]